MLLLWIFLLSYSSSRLDKMSPLLSTVILCKIWKETTEETTEDDSKRRSLNIWLCSRDWFIHRTIVFLDSKLLRFGLNFVFFHQIFQQIVFMNLMQSSDVHYLFSSAWSHLSILFHYRFIIIKFTSWLLVLMLIPGYLDKLTRRSNWLSNWFHNPFTLAFLGSLFFPCCQIIDFISLFIIFHLSWHQLFISFLLIAFIYTEEKRCYH